MVVTTPTSRAKKSLLPRTNSHGSRASSTNSKSKPVSSNPPSSPPPPFLFRIVTTLLPIFALLLLVTTLFLFHLHHAHHDPEDDTSDIMHAYGRDQSGPNSPGGSALRQKLDLAQFLINRYDREQRERGEQEAKAMGWKGGRGEEQFVKMVKEAAVDGAAGDAAEIVHAGEDDGTGGILANGAIGDKGGKLRGEVVGNTSYTSDRKIVGELTGESSGESTENSTGIKDSKAEDGKNASAVGNVSAAKNDNAAGNADESISKGLTNGAAGNAISAGQSNGTNGDILRDAMVKKPVIAQPFSVTSNHTNNNLNNNTKNIINENTYNNTNNHVNNSTKNNIPQIDPIIPQNWDELQRALLESGILPPPIPRTRTSRANSGLLPLSKTPALEGALRGLLHCSDYDDGRTKDGTQAKSNNKSILSVASSMLAFWNEPRGYRDSHSLYTIYNNSQSNATYDPYKNLNLTHHHPFLPPPLKHHKDDNLSSQSESLIPPSLSKQSKERRRYLTFEPDTGGWNNLRMSLENIVVFAAMSGRTLVLPPEQGMYLLEARKDDTRKTRSYVDFFNFTSNPELMRRVPVITSKEFMELEGGENGLVPLTSYNDTWKQHLLNTANECEYRKKSNAFCEDLYDHYLRFGQLAPLSSEPPNDNCFIVDLDVFLYGESYIPKLSTEIKDRIRNFCQGRSPIFYSKEMHDANIWHFETISFRYRLLIHYYAFIFFTDPQLGNFYKRFVRDFLRYHEEVFCAAGKIVLALEYESYLRGLSARDASTGHFSIDAGLGDSSLKKSTVSDASDNQTNPLGLDSELVGGFSSLHIRRGDLQFKEVKFDSATWYENTKELWYPNEVLYIATDERNSSFFDGFRSNHLGPLRFLDDYRSLVGLDNIDPTLYGMIDTAVASRGRMFAGTWFSTFTGYIIRLRGYYGMSKFSSYYSYLQRKYFMQHWPDKFPSYYATEYPVGWTAIDGDEFVDGFVEGDVNPFPLQKVFPKVTKLDSRPILSSSIEEDKSLARGISGLPLSKTPALKGAKRGHIECDAPVDSLAYWNEPQGHRDYTFISPFRDKKSDNKTKYLAFQPDRGGFNNIRMSFEIMFVLAKALGRTLILPPEQPMYLLGKDSEKRERGFADFFDMSSESFQRRADVVTMEHFLRKEGSPEGLFPVEAPQMQELIDAATGCHKKNHMGNTSFECGGIHDYLVTHGTTPNITASHQCLVFDEGYFNNGVPENRKSAEEFCSSGDRKMVYVTKEMQEPALLYIQSGTKETRMLAHFYGYIHFTDESLSNFFKRYVRDLLHFHDGIFCKAGKIIAKLQEAGRKRGFNLDPDHGGGYSSLHVRRGDFQYKKTRISSEEWYKNTEEIWKPHEILYIATDETNRSFFEPFASHNHTLYFLKDFHDDVDLGAIDPNHMGMIDTIVASRGRAFVGTYFSTFSGYINRLRGYYGMSMQYSWYGTLDRKYMMQKWNNVNLDAYAKEWPDGWMGIDADFLPSHYRF